MDALNKTETSATESMAKRGKLQRGQGNRHLPVLPPPAPAPPPEPEEPVVLRNGSDVFPESPLPPETASPPPSSTPDFSITAPSVPPKVTVWEFLQLGRANLQRAGNGLLRAAETLRGWWVALYAFGVAYLEGRATVTRWRPLTVARHDPIFDGTLPIANTDADAQAGAPRLLSLDAFRGLTILGMLLVNNVALAGATPLNLTHANWNNAVHFADVIFPWFLLIVGVALPLSWASHVRRNGTTMLYVRRVLLRTLWLFALGCFVDSTVARQVTVGLGVLQIIGLAYAVGALALPRLGPFRRLLLAFILLGLHGLFLRYGPLPPGGLAVGRFTQSGNVVETLNVAFLSPLGLRGLLSVIPTGAMVLLGSVAGDLLRRDQYIPTRKSVVLGVLGVLFVLWGALWSIDLPFSKPLWTGSYILYTAGWGVLMLAAFYLLADVYRSRRIVFPLVVPGTNAIFVYVASIFVKVSILETWRWRIGPNDNPIVEKAIVGWFSSLFGRVGGGWMYTATYILFWWLVLLWMYRRRLFLRV